MSGGGGDGRAQDFSLRSWVYIDRMQPQYAAYAGTTIQGDVPIAGMAELFVEVAPSNEVFRVADVALKAADVRPATQFIEREFGLLEVHAFEPAAVQAAGRAILEYTGLTVADAIRPEIASYQVITNVDPYQAQLINKMRRGALLVPGRTMLVLEVAPAAYVTLAVNEAEKAANIEVVYLSNVGRFGRTFLSGSESEVLAARDAALSAIEGFRPQAV
jgi:ethanolamine utilization microcompartment shell protein EutL